MINASDLALLYIIRPILLSSLWVSRTGSASDWCALQEALHRFIHSFIPDIYIAPLQETYSEALSVQLRSKRNVLRLR